MQGHLRVGSPLICSSVKPVRKELLTATDFRCTVGRPINSASRSKTSARVVARRLALETKPLSFVGDPCHAALWRLPTGNWRYRSCKSAQDDAARCKTSSITRLLYWTAFKFEQELPGKRSKSTQPLLRISLDTLVRRSLRASKPPEWARPSGPVRAAVEVVRMTTALSRSRQGP